MFIGREFFFSSLESESRHQVVVRSPPAYCFTLANSILFHAVQHCLCINAKLCSQTVFILSNFLLGLVRIWPSFCHTTEEGEGETLFYSLQPLFKAFKFSCRTVAQFSRQVICTAGQWFLELHVPRFPLHRVTYRQLENSWLKYSIFPTLNPMISPVVIFQSTIPACPDFHIGLAGASIQSGLLGYKKQTSRLICHAICSLVVTPL